MEGAVTTGGVQEPGRPALRPLGLGETVDTALRLYRNNAVTLWKIVALVIVPIELIQVIVRDASLPSGTFVHNGTLYTFSSTGSSSGAGGTVALLLVTFLGLLAELLATGAVFKLQLDAYLGRPHDLGASFEFARGRVLSLLWLVIIVAVLAMVGFVLFVLPGVWFVVAASVAVPALMLEGVKGFRAIRRSLSLVRGRWWATFGRLLLAWVLYAVVSILIGLVAGLINRGINVTSVTLYLVINGLISALLLILLSPFLAAVYNVIYIDLRVRKEALDIELLASSFGGTPGSAPAPTMTPETPTPETPTPAATTTQPATPEPPADQPSAP